MVNHGGWTDATAVLGRVLAVLVATCPALLHISCPEGRLASALWPILGQHCPLLTSLELCTCDALHGPGMQELLRRQPSQLPNLHTLILRGPGHKLPDLAKHTKILTLMLPGFTFRFKDRDAWLCLPPNLCHLHCEGFQIGPPATPTNGTPTIPRLLSVTVSEGTYISLHVWDQVLQAAPSCALLSATKIATGEPLLGAS